MTPISTSRSQSQRLLDCGVDPKTADMYWNDWIIGETTLWVGDMPLNVQTGKTADYVYPAWSLSALLAMLPMRLSNGKMNAKLILESYPDEEECWCLTYHDDKKDDDLIYKEASDLIEACVQMIEAFKFLDYKLNEIEK